ncbi:MAG: type transport system ATP-binding protein [Solirubrobacteraceae bacterium]|nr:type transport system ATP-binding protein [Solirubrobacteraceae bacterium]
MPAPLAVEGLCKRYGRLEALAGFDLELAPGDCVALMGPNGSGKTTALSTIAGLLAPTSGSVMVAGHAMHEEPAAIEARRRLAFVPDQPLLYDDLTVANHLRLVACAHGVAQDGLEDDIASLLERLALAHRSDFVPHELSRGMRQKAQLACALIRPFEVLLLDEPVAGLDTAAVDTLVMVLEELRAEGAAVLVSTHQPQFAARVADRTLTMHDGRVSAPAA